MALFGWCLDAHHEGCPGCNGELTCTCPCHVPMNTA